MSGLAYPLVCVIMDLEEEAAAVRFERAVHGARRTAGVGAGREILAAPPLSIVADRQGGGIESLREKGRGVDHFRGPENRIHAACEFGGNCTNAVVGPTFVAE